MAWEKSPAGNQQQNDRRREQTATQIIEDLPTRNCRDPIRLKASMGIAHVTFEPRGNLPIAARPTMLAHRIAVVISGIIVEKLDVTDERGAGEDRLEQVMTQQCLIGCAIIERLLESIDVIKTFAGVNSFSEKILIDVR